MSYYAAGDYYRTGDPGLLSFAGGLLRRGLGMLPGGGMVSAGLGALGVPKMALPRFPRGSGLGAAPVVGEIGMPRKRRRRMNYTNPKALKRAMKRQDGFVELAKKSLKGSDYQIVTRSSQASKNAKLKAATKPCGCD